ncbi:hypothetical protein PGTUg99_024644 [Puccinia graminis f. sp. tritici]|uniref:Uncharacterized protein n=1 Tax=Puccinia graminis f. sp. tritici TaxID=56615 RepID=A0A5B0R5C5_PUCGR|nr:hypothetical protein PGTUg99_024644 [Puccinia graminis f. sp. tritici]
MLIRVVPRAIWLLAFCCSDATSLLGGNWGEIEIDGQVFNKRIILPGVELGEGINVSEKEREVLEYMATVPELHRQQSYLKPTEDSYPVRHKPSRILEESQIRSMRDDFLFIKEDLANLQEAKSVNGIPEKLEETCSWELEIGKFQTQLDNLKKILSFISLAIQRKLFRSKLNQKDIFMHTVPSVYPHEEKKRKLDSGSEMPAPRSKQKVDPATSSSVPQKIGRDELEEIESHIPKVLAKELADLLEKIASFDSRKESKKSSIETVIALRLQSIVFQALNFLYIYHLVDKEDVQDLFESNKNFLLAITNMVLMFKINVGFDKYIPTSVQEILRSSHSSHFRSLFGALDDHKKRQVSYTCLTLVYQHHIVETSSGDLDQIIDQKRMRDAMYLFLKDHQLFLFLEQDLQNRRSSKLGMPVFKLTNEGPIEGQIRKELQDLKNHFLKPGPAIKDDINLKIECLILTWIKENYREFFVDLQRNNSSLKPKLSLLNAYAHLIYEFKYVVEYLKLFVLRMDGSQFPGFKYRQLSKHSPRDLHGALQSIKLVSNYVLLVAFKHDQYIKDFVHNPLMEKYLQIENLNKYIFFPQFCIAVAKV